MYTPKCLVFNRLTYHKHKVIILVGAAVIAVAATVIC